MAVGGARVGCLQTVGDNQPPSSESPYSSHWFALVGGIIKKNAHRSSFLTKHQCALKEVEWTTTFPLRNSPPLHEIRRQPKSRRNAESHASRSVIRYCISEQQNERKERGNPAGVDVLAATLRSCPPINQ